jgi:ABC-type lipoprotein export system ATPase subunit
MRNDPSGSNWRKWDFHFHTPASFDYKDRSVTDQDIINGLISAGVSAVVITDHHVMDVTRIRNLQKLAGLNLTVFPGIELRSELGGSETVHFIGIFPEDSDVEGIWAKIQGQLEITPQDVLRKGNEAIYVPFEKGAEAIHSLGGLVSVHAGKKSNSLENIANTQRYKMAFKKDVAERHIDILEVGSIADVAGYKTKVFPTIGFPLPLVICSDNHNVRQYATPTSCWIKADCTFHGLCHVLHEPDDRVFLGDVPPSVSRVQQNKTKYIRSVAVKKTSSSGLSDHWFDFDLPYNQGLVAIVGNKGSGKSALADIVGLLGNSKNGAAFSFLSTKKFCQAKDNKAEHFEGQIVWHSGHVRSRSLAEQVDDADVEGVRYIPQAYLEDICNELSNPHQGGFGRELRAVIYSHVQEADRLGHACLDDLLDYRTRETSQAINRLKGPLLDAVKAFVKLLETSADSYRKAIENHLAAKRAELAARQAAKPAEVTKPQSDPALMAQTAATETAIQETENELRAIETQLLEANQNRLVLSKKVASADKFLARIDNITASIEAFRSESQADCGLLGITLDEVFSYTSAKEPLVKKKSACELELHQAVLSIGTPASTGLLADKATTERDLERLRNNLDAPNKAYQEYLVALKGWEEAEKALIGTVDAPGTIKFLERQLEELDQLPAKLDCAWGTCVEASLAVFREIVKLTDAHRTTFGPVQSFVESHPLARGRYDLQFEASLMAFGFSDVFFAHINQGRRGSFCGVEEGRSRLQAILGKADFDNEDGVRAFLNTIRRHLTHDARREPPDAVAVPDQLSKGHTAESLLSFVLGLEYLKPQVTLRWGGKDIEQLSPGERGTLLLVFYLLIDRSDTPLVIDQPEENLDNQTVVEFLVPSIKDAKARRQIILVTHNPNLAVVCDADQVICARMDKQDGHRVSYTSGAIENPIINKCLLDILEGTRPAFDNRDGKYQCEKSHSRPRHRAVRFK